MPGKGLSTDLTTKSDDLVELSCFYQYIGWTTNFQPIIILTTCRLVIFLIFIGWFFSQHILNDNAYGSVQG